MAGTATLMALKANSEARSAEDRAAADRHRGVLVLILDHLVATGYTETSAALEREGGAPLSRFAAADNVDLATIVREFETFYEMKLGKKPKLVRKVEGNNESCDGKGRNGTDRRRGRPLGAPPPSSNNASNNSNNNAGRHGADTAPGSVRDSAEGSVRLKADGLTAEQRDKYAAAAAAAGVQSQQLQGVQSKLGTSAAFGGSSDRFGENSHHVDSSGSNGSGGAAKPDLDFGLTGTSVSKANNHRNGNGSGKAGDESLEDRLLKPLPFAGDPELRALGQTISRDIFQSNPEVSWDDGRKMRLGLTCFIFCLELFNDLFSPRPSPLQYYKSCR
jgi:katanin p60 ATPase-containing subunit A1